MTVCVSTIDLESSSSDETILVSDLTSAGEASNTAVEPKV